MLTLSANRRGSGFAVETDLVGLLLRFSQIGLSFGQLGGSRLETVLGILQILKDGVAATLEDAAQETAQELNQSRDDDGQVDQVGLERIEIQSHHAASRRSMILLLS